MGRLFLNPVVANGPPVLAQALIDVSVGSGESIAIPIPAGTFQDPDADPLALTAAGLDGLPLPGWLTFDGTSLSGTVPGTFSGSLGVRITASDGQASVSDDFLLSVIGNTAAPTVANPLPDRSSLEDVPVSIPVPQGTFTDPDGDLLSLSDALADGSPLPDWLGFDGNSLGLPPEKWSILRVRISAIYGLKGALNGTEEIHAGADHRDAARSRGSAFARGEEWCDRPIAGDNGAELLPPSP